MAQPRKQNARRDPRKIHPELRNTLRRRIYATQDNCGICGHPVDKTLKAGSPLSPELDEIMPVSRGGSPYDYDNLQLTHRRCNRTKGSKVAGEGGVEHANPLPISRPW